MRRFWYYAPQRAAVEEWLHVQLNLPRNLLFSVEPQTMDRLKGLEDEVFVRVANHSGVVPQPLWQMLSERGFTIITIDDSNNRRFREDWHGRH